MATETTDIILHDVPDEVAMHPGVWLREQNFKGGTEHLIKNEINKEAKE